MSTTDVDKMTLAQLKAECGKMGLDSKGLKAQLLARVKEHMASDAADDNLLEEQVIELLKDDEEEENMDTTEEAAEKKPESEETTKASEETAKASEETTKASEETTNGEKPKEEENAENGEKPKCEPQVFEGMSLAQLQKECKRRDLESKGEAAYIVARLEMHQNMSGPMPPMPEEEEKEKPSKKKFKKKIAVPSKHFSQKDMLSEQRMRTVICGPLTREDMNSDLVTSLFDKAVTYNTNFKTWDNGTATGYFRIRFGSHEEAKDANEKLTEYKTDLEILHLGPDEVNIGHKFTGNPHKQGDEVPALLYLHNIPEAATEEDVKELFPDVGLVMIVKDAERKHRGLAYMSFPTVEKTQEIMKKMKENEDDFKLGESVVSLHEVKGDDPKTDGKDFKKSGSYASHDRGSWKSPRGSGSYRGADRSPYQQRGGYRGARGGGGYGGGSGHGGSGYGRGGGYGGGPERDLDQANRLISGLNQLLLQQNQGGTTGNRAGGSGGGGGGSNYNQYGAGAGNYQESYNRRDNWGGGGGWEEQSYDYTPAPDHRARHYSDTRGADYGNTYNWGWGTGTDGVARQATPKRPSSFTTGNRANKKGRRF